MAKGKAAEIVLSVEERRELESLARRRSTGQGLAQRARIVLAAADGGHNGLIAIGWASAGARSASGASGSPHTVWTASTTSRARARRAGSAMTRSPTPSG